MQVFESVEDFSSCIQPLILTIGNFDGMHRGHQTVLKYAQALAGQAGEVVVLTFRNHPSEILRPDDPTKLLCPLSHKLYLLEKFGIKKVLLLPFTRYIAKHSAASFIEYLRQFIPFSHLVLGHDATLGRDRQGNRMVMQQLSAQWGFDLLYQDEYRFEGQMVSSTSIREAIKKGNFEEAENLLNRPYSIYAPVIKGEGKGKKIGFPTANLNVEGLCLPPLGVYGVEAIINKQSFQAIANLGIAPTIKTEDKPLLEVHLLDHDPDLYGQSIEVIFKKFIRNEKKFESIEGLQNQILDDIKKVKQFFNY